MKYMALLEQWYHGLISLDTVCLNNATLRILESMK
jgi:hypothetical protein